MVDENAPPAPSTSEVTDVARRTAPWTRVLGISVAAFLVLAPPLRPHPAAQRTGLAGGRPPHGGNGHTRTDRRHQPGVAALPHRLADRRGHRAHRKSTGERDGAHRDRPPRPPRSRATPKRPLQGRRRGSAPPTTLPAITHPTAADPLRVLILGDSLGIDMGGPLQNDLANTGVVQATLDARESTGLTRPDYFNWPAELQSDLLTARPQVVVIMMGANDAQDFLGPPDVPFSSPQWNVIYAQRVAAFMSLAQSDGATVIWVGMPPMQNPQLSAEMSDVNAVDQQQAALRQPAGRLHQQLDAARHAPGHVHRLHHQRLRLRCVNVRTPDGIHLTPSGGEVLSQAVLNYLRGPLHFALPLSVGAVARRGATDRGAIPRRRPARAGPGGGGATPLGALSAATSPAVRSSHRRADGPSCRRRSSAAASSGGRGSPPKSQMTVRSLSCSLKHSPLSMAQRRSSASSTCPLLRSALLATTSKAHMRIRVGCHSGLVAQGEVVRGPVLGDVALHRSLPERPVGPLDGLGHQPPPEGLRQDVGGHLAAEEPAGEVPQRALAA